MNNHALGWATGLAVAFFCLCVGLGIVAASNGDHYSTTNTEFRRYRAAVNACLSHSTSTEDFRGCINYTERQLKADGF